MGIEGNALQPQGGNVWTQDGLTAEMGFYRNPQHSAHYLHKDGKWYKIGDITTAIKAGDWTKAQPTDVPGGCKKGWNQSLAMQVVDLNIQMIQRVDPRIHHFHLLGYLFQ